MKLANKVVVVTGGNSGIGYAIAEEFQQQGARLVIFGRNLKTLDAAAAKLGKQVLTVQGDITNNEDIDRLYTETVKQFGKIDVLVANAGLTKEMPVTEITEQDFYDIVAVNFKGLFFTLQRAMSVLNDQANIIIMSSTAGRFGVAGGSPVYGATKAAATSLAQYFAAILLPRGIRVNSISPTFTATPFFDRIGIPAEQLQAIAENKMPMKRFATAEEIAKAALFLASADASYITATDLLVEGGRVNIRT